METAGRLTIPPTVETMIFRGCQSDLSRVGFVWRMRMLGFAGIVPLRPFGRPHLPAQAKVRKSKADASGGALQAPAVRFVTRRRKAGGNLVLRVPAQHGRFGAVVAVLFDVVCHFSDEAFVLALVRSAGFHAGFSILFEMAGQHFISRGMRPAVGSRSAEGFNGVGWRQGSFRLRRLSTAKRSFQLREFFAGLSL